jgi:uncharacterized membrane protein YbhN (UPF0104 family)
MAALILPRTFPRTLTPRARRVLQLAFAAAIVGGTIAVVGTGPLVRGLLAVSPGAMLAAVVLTAAATCAAAWRWRTVSSELGLPMAWSAAIAAYYRSQFVNTVLPGGVIGDVHRAYRHGRHSGDLPIAARAVVTERVAGQVVQGVATVIVLTALGLSTPFAAAWVGGAAMVIVALITAPIVAAANARARRAMRRELALLRNVFRTPRASFSIAAASLVVVAAHAATFVVACLAVGIQASPGDLVGLAMIALAAASLPINVGGWGVREAASAAAFGAIGLGAGAGLAASTAFGVLAIVAVLPGALVLIVDRIASTRTATPILTPIVHPLPEERTA